MATFVQRIIGAARLQVGAYEEVEADPHAFPQAMGVVVLSSLASGIGTGGAEGAPALAVDTGLALLGWFVWAGLTYVIGAKILGTPQTQADLGQLLRTTGFAAAPGLIRVLAAVPELKLAVLLIAQVWMLAAFVVAVRQALDYASTWRALAVCAIGWLIYLFLLYLATAPAPTETTQLLGPLSLVATAI